MRVLTASIAALGLLATVSFAQAADVGGKYKVNGTNFDGSKYSGTAEITVSSNTTCQIVWHTGGSTSKGICMRVNDVLVAGYEMSGDVGLVAYQIKSNGVLDGIWTIANKDGAGTDVLTPASE
ncbi:MAG: hypothetical protein ACLP8A_06975 [Methylovirgula sp.]